MIQYTTLTFFKIPARFNIGELFISDVLLFDGDGA